jgi:hypothetical protein
MAKRETPAWKKPEKETRGRREGRRGGGRQPTAVPPPLRVRRVLLFDLSNVFVYLLKLI